MAALTSLSENPRYREKVSWVYIMLGDGLMARNRPAEAKGAYETASRIDPDEPMVWVALAKAAVVLGDNPRAILAGGRALALAEDCPQGSILLGYALLREGRANEAAGLLVSAAEKHPQDVVLLCTLGRCYAATGRNDRAIGCYMQALRCNPQDRLARSLLNAVGTEAARR